MPRVAALLARAQHDGWLLSAQRPLLLQEFEAAGFDVYGMSFDKPKSQVWPAGTKVHRAAVQLLRFWLAFAVAADVHALARSCRSDPAYSQQIATDSLLSCFFFQWRRATGKASTTCRTTCSRMRRARCGKPPLTGQHGRAFALQHEHCTALSLHALCRLVLALRVEPLLAQVLKAFGALKAAKSILRRWVCSRSLCCMQLCDPLLRAADRPMQQR